MAALEPRVCDPKSDESRKALIANIVPYSENVERPAKPLVGMVQKLREHGTWVAELSGEPKTWERFCDEVLGRPSGWFDDLEHGVGLLCGATIEQAQTISQKVAQAKANKDSKQGQRSDLMTSGKLAEVDRSGTSNNNVLRRLARDGHDGLLDQIEAGEISVNKAAIQVGYRKKPSPEKLAVKHFRKAENKLQVLKLMIEAMDEHELSKVRVLIKELTQ